ncbi:HNH endonuclease [Streptomyces sp. L500]
MRRRAALLPTDHGRGTQTTEHTAAVRHDAAARLRWRLRERGHGWCDWCLGDFPADVVDVDHVRPLALGGEDVDGNVQVLCRECHGLKTLTEFGTPT